MSSVKKVGVMTWYHYDNYGSMLQAFALCKKIEQLGYDSMLVAYVPMAARPLKRKWTVERILCGILNRTVYRGNRFYISEMQKQRFLSFRSDLKTTSSCDTLEELQELNRALDVFVCGSDQIWSPLYFDENYFLSFVHDTQKMIAYAPSIGTMSIPEGEIREQMQKAIQRFRYLSVREEQGAYLIQELTGQKAEVVLDPTLLYSKEEWNEMFGSNGKSELPDQYILCYFLGNMQKYMRHIRFIVEQMKLPVYIIPTRTGQLRKQSFHLYDAGPIEFVSAIKGASFVCTDSFHGLAFSLIFEKQFCCYKRFAENAKNNQNSRIYNILTKLNLMERLYQPGEADIIWKDRIDYDSVTKRLEAMRKTSICYLNDALMRAVKE